jgi:hypothetical protein
MKHSLNIIWVSHRFKSRRAEHRPNEKEGSSSQVEQALRCVPHAGFEPEDLFTMRISLPPARYGLPDRDGGVRVGRFSCSGRRMNADVLRAVVVVAGT